MYILNSGDPDDRALSSFVLHETGEERVGRERLGFELEPDWVTFEKILI